MNEECSLLNPFCFFEWLYDSLTSFFVWLWESILIGLIGMLSNIPAPDFLLNLGTISFPSGVSYFLEMAVIDDGVLIFVSAYTIRFLIRRIPIIG